MIIIIDTDALLGLTFKEDQLHDRVIDLYKQIPGTIPFVLGETLAEYATLASIRFSREQAQQYIGEIVESHELTTLDIGEYKAAIELYKQQTAKGNSLFDC